MKTKITLLVLFFAFIMNAQITPSLHNNFGTAYINSTYLDKATNNLYLIYTDAGSIKRVNLNAPNLVVVNVLSGLTLPIDATVVNNKLYYLEAATGLNSNEMPIQNTGKLSWIDLSMALPNPPISNIYSDLNIPIRIAANSSHLFIDENSISIIDPDDFENQTISKISLAPPHSKTTLLSQSYYSVVAATYPFEHFEVINNDLYANTYYTNNIGNFSKINVNSPTRVITHSFTQNAPYDFGINQNIIYYTDGNSSGGNYKTSLTSTNVSPLTLNFTENGDQVYFEDWEFDSNNNAFVISSSYNSTTNTETMLLYKYTSQQLSTNQNIFQSKTTFSPNPATSSITFSQEISSLEIFDITGKKVKSFKNPNVTYDVSNLEKGIYLLKGTTIEGESINDKLIKE